VEVAELTAEAPAVVAEAPVEAISTSLRAAVICVREILAQNAEGRRWRPRSPSTMATSTDESDAATRALAMLTSRLPPSHGPMKALPPLTPAWNRPTAVTILLPGGMNEPTLENEQAVIFVMSPVTCITNVTLFPALISRVFPPFRRCRFPCSREDVEPAEPVHPEFLEIRPPSGKSILLSFRSLSKACCHGVSVAPGGLPVVAEMSWIPVTSGAVLNPNAVSEAVVVV